MTKEYTLQIKIDANLFMKQRELLRESIEYIVNKAASGETEAIHQTKMCEALYGIQNMCDAISDQTYYKDIPNG